jgi:hypothetical protein
MGSWWSTRCTFECPLFRSCIVVVQELSSRAAAVTVQLRAEAVEHLAFGDLRRIARCCGHVLADPVGRPPRGFGCASLVLTDRDARAAIARAHQVVGHEAGHTLEHLPDILLPPRQFVEQLRGTQVLPNNCAYVTFPRRGRSPTLARSSLGPSQSPFARLLAVMSVSRTMRELRWLAKSDAGRPLERTRGGQGDAFGRLGNASRASSGPCERAPIERAREASLPLEWLLAQKPLRLRTGPGDRRSYPSRNALASAANSEGTGRGTAFGVGKIVSLAFRTCPANRYELSVRTIMSLSPLATTVGCLDVGYRLGSDRGSPKHGSTLLSKWVIALMRRPLRVRTYRPVPWLMPSRARR